MIVPTVPSVSPLVAAAVRKQQVRNLSDKVIADRMGISRETWNKVRRGEKLPGPKVLSGIMRAFPDLAPDILRYLQEGNHDTEQ